MLAVRTLGGSVEAQAAALLHDAAHTALSHVVDSAFGYVVHEQDKLEWLATTSLRETLSEYFSDPNAVLDEHLHPLLERDAPKLCADRLDYGLRDSVAFQLLPRDTAHAIVADLVAFNGEICVRTVDKAKKLAIAYMASDRCAWSEPRHSAMYFYAAQAIKLALDHGIIHKLDLWINGDAAFWALLVDSTDSEVRAAARRVRHDITVDEMEEDADIVESERCADWIVPKTKWRVIDPDVITQYDEKGQPIASKRLSELDDAYGQRMARYIASKSGRKRYRVCWPDC